MARLGKTTSELLRFRRRWDGLAVTPLKNGAADDLSSRTLKFQETTDFGANPGALRMLSYAPKRKQPKPALVVVLHGCTQSVADYDDGAGWSRLADKHGFVLLFPEQRKANNANTCFNWFQTSDIARDAGEAASIREMIEAMATEHDVDRGRIFVTGLSAGGAMAAVMLAAYPEVFAAGAIVAGLPYGTAGSVHEAFESMFQSRVRPATAWGDLVRGASPHRGPWPRVSIWHGAQDRTVVPQNGQELVKQWLDVHSLVEADGRTERLGAHVRRVWTNRAGEAVELYEIAGMGHGVPIAAGADESVRPYILDVGLSSTKRIAAFWGLTAPVAAAAEPPAERALKVVAPPSGERPSAGEKAEAGRASRSGFAGRMDPPSGGKTEQPRGVDVGSVISKALKAAGLMR